MESLTLYKDEINRFLQTLSTPEISNKISSGILSQYQGYNKEQYKFMYYLLRKFPGVCFLIEPEIDKYEAPLLIDYRAGTYRFDNKFKELMYQCINNKSVRFIVIPLNIFWSEESGHNEVIIVDKKYGTIERFEPYGIIDDSRIKDDNIEKVIQRWGEEVVNRVTPTNYTYYSPYVLCPNINWQTFQEKNVPLDQRIDPGGYCVAYSLLYTELRLKFPDIPQDVLQEQLILSLNRDPNLLLEFIRNYTYSIIESAKYLNPEAAKSVITSLLYTVPTYRITKASINELEIRSVYQLRNCNPDTRWNNWLVMGGPLRGRYDIGCAINVLTYLGYFDVKTGGELVDKCDARSGTPFDDITNYINTTTRDIYSTGIYNLLDVPILTTEGFSAEVSLGYRNAINKFFLLMHSKLEENSCTIVKLERLLRCSFLGHTIVLAKKNGALYTVDPQTGKLRETVNSRGEIEFEVLNKIVNAWQKSCVIMIKYMYLLLKLDKGISTKEKN